MIRVYEGTTRLQKIGICEGIKAKNLKIGDVLVWNFGGTSTVKEITFSKTGKTLTIVEECNGKDYTRRLGAERIVVVKELNPVEEVKEVEVEEMTNNTKTVKGQDVAVGDVVELQANNINGAVRIKKLLKGAMCIEVLDGDLKGQSYSVAFRNITSIKEVNPVEEMIAEAKAVVEGLKDMESAEAVKVVDETLDKIDSIINTIEEDEKRWELRDIENHLKWIFGALEEMAEVEAREQAQKEEVAVESTPAQPKKTKSVFGKWLHTFVEEKGLDLNSEFTVEHREELHFVSLGYLLELIERTSKEEQARIKNVLVQIDFKNGDVMHFFNHLANGYIKTNY